MKDNILQSTNSLRTSLTAFKKKISSLKIGLEELGTSLEELDLKVDRLVSSSEIYKAKLKRETGRDVKLLELENASLRRQIPAPSHVPEPVKAEMLRVASTMAVFESVLMHMCENAPDFRVSSSAFLFPAVFERVSRAEETAYFLDKVPASAAEVVRRGKEFVEWIRSECGAHLTDVGSWEHYQPAIVEWWRNDALPLLYGSRDEEWDIDEPLSLTEMLTWQDNPGDRPIHFGPVFDAYEIYQKHKDEVYEKSGVKDFDLKMFARTPND